jgi:AcrR family transcriptional regulator
MNSLPDLDRRPSGLRERKKTKTRAAIRQHALRLFREQGYAATTTAQIAAAAEVSERTLFRYFPSKEELVVRGDFDTLVIAAFRAQPAELGPIQALRKAIHSVLTSLAPDELAQERQRQALIFATPELGAHVVDQLSYDIPLLAEIIAERLGREANDFAVRTLAGALVGVGLSATLAAGEDPTSDFLSLFDVAMAQLETGFPL